MVLHKTPTKNPTLSTDAAEGLVMTPMQDIHSLLQAPMHYLSSHDHLQHVLSYAGLSARIDPRLTPNFTDEPSTNRPCGLKEEPIQ